MIYELPKEWHLLAQESHLIQALLANGFTDLRKANLDRKGLFYAGFYNVAIGLERLMKATLIINYIQANRLACPSSDTLRSYGHDLKKLLIECQKIASDNGITCSLAFSGTKSRILDFLDRYSRKLRYYNLDALSGSTASADPLEEWNSILREIFSKEVSRRSANRKIGQSLALASLLGESAIMMFHDLEKNPLSLEGCAIEPHVVELAAPYVCWHIIEMVHEINKVQFTVADAAEAEAHRMGLAAPVVPYVREFYSFLKGGRSRHLRKVRWP